MPTYIYHCPKCDDEFEEEMDSKEKKTPPCPDCGCKETRKVIKPTPVIYHADGFTLKKNK